MRTRRRTPLAERFWPKTVREIAALLNLSTQGVHYHLKRIEAEQAEREQVA